jgi:hypothetical protein
VNKRKLAELERKLGTLAKPRSKADKREARFLAQLTPPELTAIYEARKRALGIPDESAMPWKYGRQGSFDLADVLPFVDNAAMREHLEQLAEEPKRKRQK